MGHRALVAYERPDGLYNLHYSHWGGSGLRLKHDLTPERPFGGGHENASEARSLADALLAGAYDEADDLSFPDLPAAAVAPEPWRTAVDFETTITEELDYHNHEAFYLVDPSYAVIAYRTYWFGLQHDCQADVIDHPTVGFGALKSVSWVDGEVVRDAYDRGKWRALKDGTGDLLDRGVFGEQEALRYLEAKLRQWASGRDDLLVRGLPDRL